MEVSGICSHCGRVARPVYSCRLCGSMVDKNCFFIDSGLCITCASKFRKL